MARPQNLMFLRFNLTQPYLKQIFIIVTTKIEHLNSLAYNINQLEGVVVKTSDNLDKDEKTLSLTEREFHLRQVERKNRITIIKEEMDKWRQPQTVKIISSRKYR